jgi:alpha-L-rhamnosidase
VISPLPGGGLSWVDARYQSIYGEIKVNWKAMAGRIVLIFSIPPNTTATVKLSEVKEIIASGALKFAHARGECSARCGSGEYRIEYLPHESVDLTDTD